MKATKYQRFYDFHNGNAQNVIHDSNINNTQKGWCKDGNYTTKVQFSKHHSIEEFLNACRSDLTNIVDKPGIIRIKDSFDKNCPIWATKTFDAMACATDNGTVNMDTTAALKIERVTSVKPLQSLDHEALQSGYLRYQYKSNGDLGGMLLALELFQAPGQTTPTILKVNTWVPTPGKPCASSIWQFEVEKPEYRAHGDGRYFVATIGVSVNEISFKGPPDDYYALAPDSLGGQTYCAAAYKGPHWIDANADRDTETGVSEALWSRHFDAENKNTYSSGIPVAFRSATRPKMDVKFKVMSAPAWLKLSARALGGFNESSDKIGCGLGESTLDTAWSALDQSWKTHGRTESSASIGTIKPEPIPSHGKSK